jgi:hypothetical protein
MNRPDAALVADLLAERRAIRAALVTCSLDVAHVRAVRVLLMAADDAWRSRDPVRMSHALYTLRGCVLGSGR